ncbi:MAG: metal-dependent hydrolase [Candidatus Hodarchaeales archaeon]|jgi:hypothetical protein
MMPYSHLLSAFIVARLLQLDPDTAILFLIGSIVPDLDFIPAIIMHRNHREFLPHWLLFWFFGLIFVVIIGSEILSVLFIGGLFHLVLDFLDWGLKPLQPFHGFETRGLIPIDETFNTQKVFFQAYYQSKLIVTIESLLLLFSAVLLLFPNI